MLPFCPFYVAVFLSEPTVRSRGTLLIKGLLVNLRIATCDRFELVSGEAASTLGLGFLGPCWLQFLRFCYKKAQ